MTQGRTRSTFAERLGFARWLKHLLSGTCPGNADIGRAVERTGQWVTKWEDSAEAPTDYRVHRPLAGYLGVPERWLIESEGEPPETDLWKRWIIERHRAPTSRVRRATADDATEKGRGRAG